MNELGSTDMFRSPNRRDEEEGASRILDELIWHRSLLDERIALGGTCGEENEFSKIFVIIVEMECALPRLLGEMEFMSFLP